MADPFANLFGPGAPRSVTETPRATGSPSPFGFLGNVLAEARDITTGLSGVVSGVGSDIINLAQGHTSNLFTPHFLGSLPGTLASDYGRRYSPQHIGGELYSHPLSYLFDFLAAGDLAAKGAEAAATRGVESPIIDAIRPTTRKVLESPIERNSPQIIDVLDARNPVKRVLINAPMRRLMYQPIGNLEQEIGKLKGLESPLPSVQDRIGIMEDALNRARAQGAAYYEQPKYAKYRIKREINKLVGEHQTVFGHNRAELEQELSTILEPLGKLPDPEISLFDKAVMGVHDMGLHQFAPDELIPQVQRKGFADLNDAADALFRGDPRAAALSFDEQATLRRSFPSPLDTTAVKDAEGNPLRVFHGSPNEFAGFDMARADPMAAFGPGIYATDDARIASEYSSTLGRVTPLAGRTFVEGANVRPFYLDIKNPFQADVPLQSEVVNRVAEVLRTEGHPAIAKALGEGTLTGDAVAFAKAMDRPVGRITNTDLYRRLTTYFDGDKSQVNAILHDAGFDGVEYQGGLRLGGEPHRAFVAFSPDQVYPFKPNANAGYARWQRPLPVQDLSTPAQATQPAQDLNALQQAAQTAEVPFLDRLRQAFGAPSVVTRVKPFDRLVQKSELEGLGSVTDALGARVLIPNWREADATVAKIGQQFPVAGIEDTRALPMTSGQRALRVHVSLPDGQTAEIEVGTHDWAATRDAMATTEHDIQATRNELAQVNRSLQTRPDLSSREHEALMVRGAFLDKRARYMEMQSQSVWEPVADEIDQHLTGAAMPGGEKRVVYNQLRRWVWGRLTKPMVDAGIIDAAGTFERAYLPLRLESGARWDPVAKDLTGGFSADQLHAERMANDLPMPIYFHFYDAARMKPSDYLTRRALTGGLRSVVRPNYLKHAKGKLYLADRYVKDPKDALMRRAVAMLRYRDGADLYKKFLEVYARPIDSTAEVDNTFERFVAPMGTLNFFNTKIGMTDRLMEKLASRMGVTKDDIAEIMSEIQPNAAREVIGVTRKGVQMYAVPKHAADLFEKHVTVPMFENTARLFWDQPMKVWRSMVLTARPAWVANNVLGNVFFTKMQGGSLLRVIRQLDGNYRRALDEIVPAEQKAGVNTGLFIAESPEAGTHLGMASKTRTGEFYDAVSNTWHSNRVLKKISGAAHQLRQFNAGIENAFRRESFLTAVERANGVKRTTGVAARFLTSTQDLRRIAQHGIDPQVASRALDEVNYFFNDYNGLGPIERSYVRRFMVPFYSFYKHIVRLALRYPFDYGARSLVGTNLARMNDEMNRETLGAMPQWLQGASPLGPVLPGQDTAFLGGSSANPFSTLLSVTDGSFVNLLYPVPKIAIEQTTGRSALTGQQFTDANVISPFGIDQQFRRLPSGEIVPVSKVVPGIGEHLLQQVPIYSLLKELVAGGKTPSTETLPTVIKDRLLGRSALVRGLTGTTFPVGLAQALGGYVGVPTYKYNLSNYQSHLQEGALKAQEAFLRRDLPPPGSAPVPPAPAPAGGSDPFAGLFG